MIMKKVKLGLVMAMVASSSMMMGQQSVSLEKNKFEMKTIVAKNNQESNDKGLVISDIKMFPNPASDLVTLQGVKVDDQISITDNKGKTRLQIKAKAEVEIIPIDFLESGIYLLAINGEKRRLIVENK
ncbi:T9SS type A sorting domain-containing protein [Flavobacterium sp. TP390]|uniref:T9SS type A sorting domain-containing protein n=2 Tax=Flavobacterium profundi TaxID=1774945 RepID=A0A6I4IU68_9FLAO|nr:T9SS type A sorting domain-containing protein [Flavobacterium profundi]